MSEGVFVTLPAPRGTAVPSLPYLAAKIHVINYKHYQTIHRLITKTDTVTDAFNNYRQTCFNSFCAVQE